MNKIIITVVGKDTVGIIARVCTWLADHRLNILDISQTIVQGYFNMMELPFTEIADSLEKLGTDIGVVVKCQREEIFESMHRL